jgi:shikimate dehydrogenase
MRTYGLIGYPLSHSFSRRFFTDYFSDQSIEAQYLNFEIDNISLLQEVILSQPELVGFNVTIPYKQAVIPFLNECDQGATAIRAVNTVKICRSGSKTLLKGYNTDLIGFRDSIKPLLKDGHRKALILGTGGASKAIVEVLHEMSISTLLVSRTAIPGVSTDYDHLSEEIMGDYTLVVNTSPVGTYPNVEEFPQIPYQFLGRDHLLYDLVYNPEVTGFLRRGAERGALIKNGREMLELQALAAWKIWNEAES